MRTVKETFAQRLELQKKEADVQGLTKVASNLEHVVDNLQTREDAESYLYLEKDAAADAEKHIWDAVVRFADYFDCNIDAAEMQHVIERVAIDLMQEVRSRWCQARCWSTRTDSARRGARTSNHRGRIVAYARS